jgi:hypothetical protein
VRHRCIQHLRDPAGQCRVRCIDHSLIRVEVKGQHGSARTRHAHHLPQRRLRPVQVAQDTLGPAQIESVVREIDITGVANFESDRQGQVRCTPTSFGDHGRIGVDPGDPSLSPYQLGNAEHRVPESAWLA